MKRQFKEKLNSIKTFEACLYTAASVSAHAIIVSDGSFSLGPLAVLRSAVILKAELLSLFPKMI